jgi:hypothetical protein
LRNQTQLERVELLESNSIESTELNHHEFTTVEHDEIVQMFANIRMGYCDGLGSDYAGIPPIWVTSIPIISIAKPIGLWETNDRGELMVPPTSRLFVEERRYQSIQHFVDEIVRYFLDDNYINQEVFIYTISKQQNRHTQGLDFNGPPTYWVRWCKKSWGGDKLTKKLINKNIKKHKFGTTN